MALPDRVRGGIRPSQSVTWKRESGEAEDLTGARHLLDAAGLTYRVHTRVGQAAAEICDLARELAVDQIVIGTRGQGAAAAAIMGSVASETVEKAPVPVLVVKN